MCRYVCVCTCVFVYMHMHIHTHTHTYMYKHNTIQLSCINAMISKRQPTQPHASKHTQYPPTHTPQYTIIMPLSLSLYVCVCVCVCACARV